MKTICYLRALCPINSTYAQDGCEVYVPASDIRLAWPNLLTGFALSPVTLSHNWEQSQSYGVGGKRGI